MDTTPQADNTLRDFALKWLAVTVNQYGVTAADLQPSPADSLATVLYKLARIYSEYLPAPGAVVPCCEIASGWRSLQVILDCLAFAYGGAGAEAGDTGWVLLYKILTILKDHATGGVDLFGDGNTPRAGSTEWELYAKILSLAVGMPQPNASHLLAEVGDVLSAENSNQMIYE